MSKTPSDNSEKQNIKKDDVKKADSIDEIFGIWKDRENFDKDKFRDNAWREQN